MSTAPKLTIDLNALKSNWEFMREKSGKAETSAVIKANGYGLGIKPVAKALAKAGCETFFVAMVEEAAQVREAVPASRIVILNGVLPETIDDVKQLGVIPVLSSLDQMKIWAEKGNRNPSAIHIDTGMNRLGITPEEAEGISIKIDLLESINPTIVMSHLACGDDPDHEQNTRQLERFLKATKTFSNLERSLANSAGIMMGADYRFNLTRPGIALFGGEAVNDVPNPMTPVVEAKARILQIRHTKAGENVGYGPHCVLERDSVIAVCSGGYADGFHRSLSGSGIPLRKDGSSGGFGAVGGKLAPILGRVSMDLTAFDVTDIEPEVLQYEEYVELFGKTIPVDVAARHCGTIGYELLTSLGNRYQREYLGG